MIYSRDGMNRRYTQNAQFNLSNLSPYTNEMLSTNQAATVSNVSSAVKINYDDYLGINTKPGTYSSTNESINKPYAQYVPSETAPRGGNYYPKIENYVPMPLNYNIPREMKLTKETRIPGNSGKHPNNSISSHNVHNKSRQSSKNSDVTVSKNQHEGMKNNGHKEVNSKEVNNKAMNNKAVNAMNLSLNKLEKKFFNATNDLAELNETNKVTDNIVKNNRKTGEYSVKSDFLKNTLSWDNSNNLRNAKKKGMGRMAERITRHETTDEIGHKHIKTNSSVVYQNNSQEARRGGVVRTNGTSTASQRVVIKLNENLEKEKAKFSENPMNTEGRRIKIYEGNHSAESGKEREKETIRFKREEAEIHNKSDIKREDKANEKGTCKVSEGISGKNGNTNTSPEVTVKENSANKSALPQEKKKMNKKASAFLNIKGTLPHVVPLNMNEEIINKDGALKIFKDIIIIDKYNGLKEWNGYEWQNIESTYTFFIKARYDNKGNLWCINDLYEILKITNEKFQSFGRLGNEEAIDIGFDKRNVLWCINRKGDLLKWSKTEWKKISYSGFHKLSSIAFDKEGRLWGINSKRALAVWNPKDKRWEEKIIKNNVKIACMDFDDNGMLWVVTTTGTLLSYCSGNWINYGLICRNHLISISFRRI